LRYISLLLLPALVPKSVSGISRNHPNGAAALDLRHAEPVLLPYLAFVGGPPLRFQEAPPPRDLSTHLAAGAPPHPAAEAPPDAPAALAASVDPKPAVTVAAVPPAPDKATPSPGVPATPETAASLKTPPPSILPDDARPAIRPEDFLPYFQIPGSGKPGGMNLLVPVPTSGAPAPALLPPSSATYTQSK
jgi:hypothetical protein